MSKQANAQRLIEACEQVLTANRNLSETMTEVIADEADNPEEIKETIDTFGGLIQAFFGINVGIMKLKGALEKAKKNEKTD